MQKIVVVIPTYNERSNIARLIRKWVRVAATYSYDLSILVVDGGSPDNTADEVNNVKGHLGLEDSLVLINNEARKGLGNAYKQGIWNACKLNPYVIVLMDADQSHDPEDVPQLIHLIEAGADLVVGSRYIRGAVISREWPLKRRLLSLIANWMARRLIGPATPIEDLTGGLKVIRKSVLEQIDLGSLRANGYVFQVSLIHAFISRRLKIVEAPITFTNRASGKSKLRLRDVVEFIYRVYKLNPDAPLQKLIRFVSVGLGGAVVNLIVLFLCVHFFKLHPLTAIIIAIELSIIFNFFLNHLYTFRGYGAYAEEKRDESLSVLFLKFVKFNIATSIGAIISFSTFFILDTQIGLQYLLADAIAILTATGWNYSISTRYIWRAIDPDYRASPEE